LNRLADFSNSRVFARQGAIDMSYLISLGAGLVVGLLYYFSRVQSPAPPLIALAGLLGIVIGEHAIPFVQAHWSAPQAQTQSAPPQRDVLSASLDKADSTAATSGKP
jgi:XapX domain-containing protein